MNDSPSKGIKFGPVKTSQEESGSEAWLRAVENKPPEYARGTEEWYRARNLPTFMMAQKSGRAPSMPLMEPPLTFMMSQNSGRAPPPASVSGAPLHGGVWCNGCNVTLGFESRFKCLDCLDYDLCLACKVRGTDVRHADGRHVFAEFRDSRGLDPQQYVRNPK